MHWQNMPKAIAVDAQVDVLSVVRAELSAHHQGGFSRSLFSAFVMGAIAPTKQLGVI
jgi:hypothetical protein